MKERLKKVMKNEENIMYKVKKEKIGGRVRENERKELEGYT